jgi:transketolase
VIGDAGVAIGVDEFGASAPDKILFEQYGFTTKAVVEAAKRSLAMLS